MSNKIEDAIRLLAQHAPTDVRQQIEAMFPPAQPPKNGETNKESRPAARHR